ncbi:MAG: hypothetical protein Q7V02_05895 [Methylophilus sp.]|nr:hypothetical protein [Methylophilus sp.]
MNHVQQSTGCGAIKHVALGYVTIIPISTDAYITTINDEVDWLETSGKTAVDLDEQSDMGFSNFIASVDCIIMAAGA